MWVICILYTHTNIHTYTYIYMHICIYKYILLAAYYLGSEHEDIGRYKFKLNGYGNGLNTKMEMKMEMDILSALAHQMGQIFYC